MKNLLLICFMLWNTAFACTCVGESTVKNAVKYSDFVFTGKVISSEQVSLIPENMDELFVESKKPFYARMKYVFEISAVYKGKVKADTLVVYTGFGGGDCGYKFRVGYDYVVYARWNRTLKEADLLTPLKFLETDICTRTGLFDSNEVAEIRKYSKKRK